MPRVRLNTLLDDAKHALDPIEGQLVAVEKPVVPEAPARVLEEKDGDPQPRPVPEKTSSVPARARRTSPRADRQTHEPVRVHYSSLTRKEARLRDDQIESLTSQARRLNRSKVGADQRITDNTLIRVAIDLLLARGDLAGSSEAELRKSVGL